MTRTASTSGYELGLLAAAGTLTIIPGAIVIYFVKKIILQKDLQWEGFNVLVKFKCSNLG